MSDNEPQWIKILAAILFIVLVLITGLYSLRDIFEMVVPSPEKTTQELIDESMNRNLK